jgi:hypothetical protein
VHCTSATITTLDAAGDVGGYTSLATGADGLGLIAYHDLTSHALKVAHCSDALCSSATITAIDPFGASDISLAIGADGRGLIAYGRGNTIQVAHCSDLPCTSATLSPVGQGDILGAVSLTIGADGLGLVTFSEFFHTYRASIAHCSNAACSSATYVDGGPPRQYPSMAAGTDGRALISYRVTSPADLAVEHCEDAGCATRTRSVLDAVGEVGEYSSLAIGSDGLGLIAYHDKTNGSLKVAHCADVPCTSATTATIDGSTRFHVLAPCRVADTRITLSPLPANQARAFAVAGSCGVPPDARAVAANIIAVNPGQGGHLQMYPAGHLLPATSVVNFAEGQTRANNALAALGTGGQIMVLYGVPPGSSSSTHMVLDVFGYFR